MDIVPSWSLFCYAYGNSLVYEYKSIYPGIAAQGSEWVRHPQVDSAQESGYRQFTGACLPIECLPRRIAQPYLHPLDDEYQEIKKSNKNRIFFPFLHPPVLKKILTFPSYLFTLLHPYPINGVLRRCALDNKEVFMREDRIIQPMIMPTNNTDANAGSC